MALGTVGTATGADTIFFENGAPRTGRMLALNPRSFVIEVTLPTPPGRTETSAVTAKVTIPREGTTVVEFGPDDALKRALAGRDPAILAALWTKWEPWLALPRSPAPEVGLACAESLLSSGKPEVIAQALTLFTSIESSAWDPGSRGRAKQGRLRAMIAGGRAAEAVEEAAELAKITEDPAVLIEANFIRAKAADAALRKLIEENPRWEEDVFVVPEHARLHNEALDLYLHPSLFLGSEAVAAARGLAGGIGIHKLTGDLASARELARDLVGLYPETAEASKAQAFLDALPKDLLASNPEQEARQQDSPSPSNEQDTQ